MSKDPINVECRLYALSDDAREWLNNYTSDLAWGHRDWRIWESPAEYDELDRSDRMKWLHSESKGLTYNPPLKKRRVDVVRFASKRDALYFKLVFL